MPLMQQTSIDRDIIIFLFSQLPLAIYTIASGIARFKSDTQKLKADRDSSLSGALQGAGQTLEDVWKEIREVRKELDIEIEKRRKLEKELRRWIRFANLLSEEVKRKGGNVPQFPDDTPAV